MKRILCFDYGEKRTGIAVSDNSHIIASPFKTILTLDIFNFIKDFLSKEEVFCLVFGLPKNLDNTNSNITDKVIDCVDKIKNTFADIPVYFEDERYTSKMAKNTILMSGVSKSKRRNKENIDKVSACLILQSFLSRKDNNKKKQTFAQ